MILAPAKWAYWLLACVAFCGLHVVVTRRIGLQAQIKERPTRRLFQKVASFFLFASVLPSSFLLPCFRACLLAGLLPLCFLFLFSRVPQAHSCAFVCTHASTRAYMRAYQALFNGAEHIHDAVRYHYASCFFHQMLLLASDVASSIRCCFLLQMLLLRSDVASSIRCCFFRKMLLIDTIMPWMTRCLFDDQRPSCCVHRSAFIVLYA